MSRPAPSFYAQVFFRSRKIKKGDFFRKYAPIAFPGKHHRSNEEFPVCDRSFNPVTSVSFISGSVIDII
jgi:hypothetical protein